MYHLKHMGHLKLNFSVPLRHSAVTPSIFLVSIMNTTPALFDLCCSENSSLFGVSRPNLELLRVVCSCIIFAQKNIKNSNYR